MTTGQFAGLIYFFFLRCFWRSFFCILFLLRLRSSSFLVGWDGRLKLGIPPGTKSGAPSSGAPPLPRSRPSRPVFFIILRILQNCLISPLTCSTGLPLPRAIRLRLEKSIKSGFSLSFSVID